MESNGNRVTGGMSHSQFGTGRRLDKQRVGQTPLNKLELLSMSNAFTLNVYLILQCLRHAKWNRRNHRQINCNQFSYLDQSPEPTREQEMVTNRKHVTQDECFSLQVHCTLTLLLLSLDTSRTSPSLPDPTIVRHPSRGALSGELLWWSTLNLLGRVRKPSYSWFGELTFLYFFSASEQEQCRHQPLLCPSVAFVVYYGYQDIHLHNHGRHSFTSLSLRRQDRAHVLMVEQEWIVVICGNMDPPVP